VSEQFLNGTSAQCHSRRYTLENTGQQTSQKQTTKTKDNPEKKQTAQNTAKQNYPGSVVSYDTRPTNEAGLLEHQKGQKCDS